MTRLARARLGLLAAGLLTVVGVGLAVDVAVALIAAGVELGAWFLLAYDVDEGQNP